MEKNNKFKISLGKVVLAFISLGIFIITFLISYKSDYNVHPDEYVHYCAVQYYQTHSRPPKLDSENIINTYSVHGESRLTELDIYYFLVGKYTNVLNKISKNEIFNARSFNLILLAIILIISYRLYRNNSSLFLPFLLSSQVWYIFSYINNDAWAIFLNLIFVYQLFFEKSMFNILINMSKKEFEQNKLKSILYIITLGILFFLLLIAKVNYLVATGINAIIYLIVNRQKIFNKEKILRVFFVLLIGILLFGVRMGIDFKINGLDRINNMENIRLLRANEQFKAPYPQGAYNNTNFKLKDRGYPISKVITNDDFYKTTLNSFIGVYGYMDKNMPNIIYNLIFICYIVIILYLIYGTAKQHKNDIGEIAATILVVLGGIITLALSIYRSYTYDYQPQGRYMFAIIPLLCALMYCKKESKILKVLIFIIAIILIVCYIRYGLLKFL